MSIASAHSNPKVAAAQRKLLEADDRLRDISRKRRDMFVAEEDAAKQAKAKAEREIRREAALDILLPIRDRINSGEAVTGTRRFSIYIDMRDIKVIDRPTSDFTITNVHIGRKHFGVHVKYNGSQKQHWVNVQDLNDKSHALHDGRQYQNQEWRAERLREILNGGAA